MGSAPGATTIRKCGEKHSGTQFKTRTSQVLSCSTLKQGLLKSWPVITEKLIKKHIDKSRNTTMGHLNMRKQRLQQTKDKPPDTDLEDKITTNVLYCTTVEPITTN